ncbi:hypothetical protein NDU88_001305 [Pleurodeles waltl]|uniref:Uncharacterized protein n=1 Tax=Pleurodeles waltl TaxID=8319 RepID=A0AAV7L941_PLEWA|nr:hypothetical protein NDU88_001305 [Pleurodeles waltl]
MYESPRGTHENLLDVSTTECAYVIRRSMDERKAGRSNKESFSVQQRTTSRRTDVDRRRSDRRMEKEGRRQTEVREQNRRARKHLQRTGRVKKPATSKEERGSFRRTPGSLLTDTDYLSRYPTDSLLQQPLSGESEFAMAHEFTHVGQMYESPRRTHENLVDVSTTELAYVIRRSMDVRKVGRCNEESFGVATDQQEDRCGQKVE